MSAPRSGPATGSAPLLAGLRVLELSELLPSYATSLPADLGAEVLKVEPRGAVARLVAALGLIALWGNIDP